MGSAAQRRSGRTAAESPLRGSAPPAVRRTDPFEAAAQVTGFLIQSSRVFVQRRLRFAQERSRVVPPQRGEGVVHRKPFLVATLRRWRFRRRADQEVLDAEKLAAVV